MTIVDDTEDLARLQTYLSSIPDDQWPIAKAWLLKAIEENDALAGAMMVLVSKGLVDVVDWTNATAAGPRLTLTEAGQAHALDLLGHEARARDLFTQLSGRTIVPPPSHTM